MYNYFRDYDSQTGRYIQSDPIGLAGGINTYTYVGGSPLDSFDRLGLSEANHKDKPMDPKGEGCNNLKKRIENLKKEIARQIENLAKNPQGLPEFCPPGGSYKDSVQGHRDLLEKYRKDLQKNEDSFKNRCSGGGDPSGGAPAITADEAAAGVGVGTVLYWIISEGSRIFPPRNLVPIP